MHYCSTSFVRTDQPAQHKLKTHAAGSGWEMTTGKLCILPQCLQGCLQAVVGIHSQWMLQ